MYHTITFESAKTGDCVCNNSHSFFAQFFITWQHIVNGAHKHNPTDT